MYICCRIVHLNDCTGLFFASITIGVARQNSAIGPFRSCRTLRGMRHASIEDAQRQFDKEGLDKIALLDHSLGQYQTHYILLDKPKTRTKAKAATHKIRANSNNLSPKKARSTLAKAEKFKTLIDAAKASLGGVLHRHKGRGKTKQDSRVSAKERELYKLRRKLEDLVPEWLRHSPSLFQPCVRQEHFDAAQANTDISVTNVTQAFSHPEQVQFFIEQTSLLPRPVDYTSSTAATDASYASANLEMLTSKAKIKFVLSIEEGDNSAFRIARALRSTYQIESKDMAAWGVDSDLILNARSDQSFRYVIGPARKKLNRTEFRRQYFVYDKVQLEKQPEWPRTQDELIQSTLCSGHDYSEVTGVKELGWGRMPYFYDFISSVSTCPCLAGRISKVVLNSPIR